MAFNMDFILNGQFQGDVAKYLANNGQLNPHVLRPFFDEQKKQAYINVYKGSGDPMKTENYVARPVNNATLRRDEWKQLDEAVLRIAEYRLNGIQDLIDNGLVYNLGNGMGTTVLEYHDVGDAQEADLTMDGISRSKGDRPNFETNYLPIPIIHADFEINSRALSVSRNLGNPLDTIMAERAARKVSERLENMLFTNTSYTYGGGTIYSYVNFPQRNQVTLAEYGNWDTESATTGASILECVLDMKQASINDFHYGPWMLYIPTGYETRLDNDYDTTTPGTTIRERIMKIAGIKGIKVVDTLPANNVLLVEMNTETVRLVRGMGVQTVQWDEEGKFVNKYKVMTIQVPQIRADQEGHCGIVHAA